MHLNASNLTDSETTYTITIGDGEVTDEFFVINSYFIKIQSEVQNDEIGLDLSIYDFKAQSSSINYKPASSTVFQLTILRIEYSS